MTNVRAEHLAWFAGASRGPRGVMVVAHPDDETIGAGSRLAELDLAAIAVVTDGVPRNPWFAKNAGFASGTAYADVRKSELEAALRTGGVVDGCARLLGFVDQEVALSLCDLVRTLQALFVELRPDVILTQPYEGGHPDHDATAFAVHAARDLLPEAERPTVLELAYYHDSPRGEIWGELAGDPGHVFPLSPEAQARKRAMLACHRSQARVLAHVSVADERLRSAPEYDFTRPPAYGTFRYDAFDWPVRGADFLRLTAAALHKL
jgi:N-acetylglucosamine malate deacetylase 2